MGVRENPRGYGAAEVVPDKGDDLRYAGEPVSDYFQAVNALVMQFEKTGEYYDSGPLPFAADLVGRIYWVSSSRLRADMVRQRKALVR